MRSSSITEEAVPSGDLARKLLWLTAFRMVATTLILGIVAVRLLLKPPTAELSREDSISFVLIALVYGASLLQAVILRSGRVRVRVAAYVQIAEDVVLASALVYLTGGVDSPFTFTYSLAVVSASILFLQRGARLGAVAATGAFLVLAVLIHIGWVRAPVDAPPVSVSRLVFAVTSNGLAQLLIAELAGYLSRQLSTTGGRLFASERNLQRLTTLQQQILTYMPSGLMTCSADGWITFMNPAGRTILGLPAHSEAPVKVAEVLPGVDALSPGSRRNELQVSTPQGDRTLGLTLTALAESPGDQLIVFQDLTQLRKAEDELRRADRLASLGKLSAQLAHEIRNPLAAMRGSAQLLAQEPHADPSAARLSAILVRESDRLSALVESFLQFARPPPPTRREVLLSELVHDTVEMLRTDPMASAVRVETELHPVRALVDPDQLRQVLINLIRNALEAVRGAGTVRVSVEGTPAPRIRIWDSAGSIPAPDLTRIFEPFYTTRPGGTGLGLSTAHTLVRAHGGALTVQSSPHEGTEFVITFPPVAAAGSAA